MEGVQGGSPRPQIPADPRCSPPPRADDLTPDPVVAHLTNTLTELKKLRDRLSGDLQKLKVERDTLNADPQKDEIKEKVLEIVKTSNIREAEIEERVFEIVKMTFETLKTSNLREVDYDIVNVTYQIEEVSLQMKDVSERRKRQQLRGADHAECKAKRDY